ncbi:hypothetical protein [Thermohalobacter berrensis]|uniref:Uncharacterized protein n=1 Tax=Thermohalobacter berrensis TaxID=99594 RepID=A0A419TAI3_9FIRM|nr:hypothetical protein [Thermohalobacter berrensis]RKD34462.1 hypothetical protein BET03_01110 [Thermohalobacter berrensis]
MSIKPIDLQVNISKTQEAAKTKQQEQFKHNNYIHSERTNLNQKIKREQKQVNNTDKPYKMRANKDKGKGSNNRNNKKRNKNKNKKNQKEQEKLLTELGNHIDIKI